MKINYKILSIILAVIIVLLLIRIRWYVIDFATAFSLLDRYSTILNECMALPVFNKTI